MRWLATVLLLGLLGACTLGQSTSSSTTTSTGTGGTAVQCPQNTCEQGGCPTCALDGPCASLWATCMADPDCQAIDGCWSGCAGGDTTCEQGCLDANPNGASDYEAVNSCVYCDQCPTICAGQCSTST